MNKAVKKFQRVFSILMIVLTMTNISFSTVVSASELNGLSSNIEDDSEGKMQSTDSLPKESIQSNSLESEEQETSIEEDSVTDDSSPEDVYSAEEIREKAIDMVEAENNTTVHTSSTRSISKTQSFINAISSEAVAIANKYKLYPSVLVAQAALESAFGTSTLAYSPNYNLFGIKGTYNGQYFSKYSKEFLDNKWVIIESNFRKYPSYLESIEDYASKLRNGPSTNNTDKSWDENFYSGSWRENAATYQDATKALVGKYANDPSYATSLNSIIEEYELAELDKAASENIDEKSLQSNLESINTDTVIKTTNVNDYTMYVTNKSDGIYTSPKGTESSEVIYDAMKYLDKKVTVTEETVMESGKVWAKITYDNKLLGWINKEGLSKDEVILSEKNINYVAVIKRGTDNITTEPYGTAGYKNITKSSAYLNKQVTIKQEAVTDRATWSLIYIDGKEIGWVDKNALDIEEVTSKINTSYKATITRKTDNITTKPYGTEGYEIIAKASDYLDSDVQVTEEATTRRATWAYITLDGKGLGWIDKNALTQFEEITSQKDINYVAKIIRGTDNITTQPYGTKGYKVITKSSNYLNQEVKVIKEAVTDRATWAYVTKNNQTIGWVDKRALDIESVSSEKTVSYSSYIGRRTDNITTKPYGTEGYVVIAKSSSYIGKKVNVIKEATTRRATWAYITIDGKELGWIDKSGLTNNEVILSEKAIQYVAVINRTTDNITTKPYGTEGYKTIARSSKYLNKQVKVTKEAVTDRATWALISVGGKELGWIDKAALDIEKILSEKAVNYTSYINRKTDNITTKPYGTEGYTVVTKSSNHFGKKVKVTKEANTRRSEWAYISIDGKNIGWIDKSALTMDEVIISQKNIQYSAVIKRGTDNITTLPYGTNGYKKIKKSSAYLNQYVKITKEAVTDRATWAYITINGKNVGWIDKAALDIERVTSETDVPDYKARLTRKGDSISSEPWGTEGYVVKSSSSNYFGTEVTVKKEAKTRRATWVLIALNGKELGWIDKAALKKLDPNKRVVVIDAGHGGSDPGAEAGRVKEKDLNLTVSKKVQTKLKNAGYEVIMTRSTDVFVELSERARIANTSSTDIFVSIHTNSFNSISKGIETFSYNGSGNAKNPVVANDPDRLLKSSLLSEAIQDALLEETGAYDRGDKEGNFHVIRETGMPAVLTEMGFIDNASERSKLVNNNYQEKIADGIVQGIKNYFSIFK